MKALLLLALASCTHDLAVFDQIDVQPARDLDVLYVFDNSAANPHNPSSPPQRVTYGEQTTNEMALLFLQVVLPRPQDVPRFRREYRLSRLDQFLAQGGEPVGLGKAIIERLRAAIPLFDANHNGTLEPDERAAMLRFLRSRMN